MSLPARLFLFCLIIQIGNDNLKLMKNDHFLVFLAVLE